MTNVHSCARGSLSLTSFLRAGALCLAIAGVARAESPCGCSSDFNGSGSVDAADLALLLGSWGSIDADHDLSGNGVVDAADLGILLGQWGACGGPANDLCSSAEVLPSIWSQSVPFCNANAGTDGPGSLSCEFSGSNQITSDVWFKVTAPSDGLLDVSTCGANFDTKLAVYEQGFLGSTCPNGTILTATILGCNDDSSSCSDPLNSSLAVPVIAGKVYTIRVGGYLGSEGTGNLQVNFLPHGDSCSDPIPVQLTDNGDPNGATVILTGDTFHATASTQTNSCGGSFDNQDIWFKLDLLCAVGGGQPVELSASTCMPGTNFDTTLTLYKGTCGGMVELDCNDDSSLSGCQIAGVNRRSFVSINPDNTQTTYWVRLAGFNGATGSYEIKFHFKCLTFLK